MGRAEDQEQAQHHVGELVDEGGVRVDKQRKGWSTVKLKKTRNIVPDGLVQVRISNFLRDFPNLERGPLTGNVNLQSGASGVDSVGMKRKSTDQIKGPDVIKRLRK